VQSVNIAELKKTFPTICERCAREALKRRLPRLKTRGKAAEQILKGIMDAERGKILMPSFAGAAKSSATLG
jgi:hypothetical protein